MDVDNASISVRALFFEMHILLAATNTTIKENRTIKIVFLKALRASLVDLMIMILFR